MKNSIYIVEDNPDIGFILDYYLKEEGYEVAVFETAAAFSKGLERQTPDLFLLDVMLPDGNGLEICSEIKNNLKTGNIPVLIMSAHSRVEQVKQSSCADGFIQKPFDLTCMLQLINQQLGNGQ